MTARPLTFMAFWQIANVTRADAGLPELQFSDARALFEKYQSAVEAEQVARFRRAALAIAS